MSTVRPSTSNSAAGPTQQRGTGQRGTGQRGGGQRGAGQQGAGQQGARQREAGQPEAGQPGARQRGGARRYATSPQLLLPLVVGLTAILTVASGGAPIWVPRGISGLDRRTIVAALAVLFSLILLGVTLWAVVLHRRAAARGSDRSLRSIWLAWTPLALIAWVGLGLYGIAEGHLGRPPELALVGPRPEPTLMGEALRLIGGWDTPTVDGLGRPSRDGPDGNPIPSPPLLFIVALVLISVGTASWVWRRAGHRDEGDPNAEPDDGTGPLDATATHRVFADTIAAMLADPDPNTAVIGAYAQLLEGLSAAGAPRRDHEGPSEHLRRVLGMLWVQQAPLRRLVSLFESARFSSRTLTARHRTDALEALATVAAELRAGAPTVGTGSPVESKRP